MFNGAIDKLSDRLTATLNILFSRLMDELIAKKRIRFHAVVDIEDKVDRYCICGRKIDDK